METRNSGVKVPDLRLKLVTKTSFPVRFSPYKNTDVWTADETIGPAAKSERPSPVIAESTGEALPRSESYSPSQITLRNDLCHNAETCLQEANIYTPSVPPPMKKENDVPGNQGLAQEAVEAIQVILKEKEVVYHELDRVTEQWEQLRVARELLIRSLNLLDNKLLRALKQAFRSIVLIND